MRHVDNPEEKYIATINRIRDTICKLEEIMKYSRDLEAVRFLQYSTLKSRDKILADDLRKIKVRNKQMLSENKISILFKITYLARNLFGRSLFRFISTKCHGRSTRFSQYTAGNSEETSTKDLAPKVISSLYHTINDLHVGMLNFTDTTLCYLKTNN